MTDQQLVDELKQDYLDVRVLDDGTIIALGDLLFTRAIHMDCDRFGWGKRFCFENKTLADHEFYRLTSGDEEPVGYVARRNR